MARRLFSTFVALLVGLQAPGQATGQVPPAAGQPAPAPRAIESRPAALPQTRPHGLRVPIDPAKVVMDDGDTVEIRWSGDDVETVWILGIDCPETRHVEHSLPFGQDFGAEARAFSRGAFAAATEVELLRSSTLDPFGRTLGYVFLNGRNYSVLVVRARLAAESVSHFGDNGLPKQAAEVVAAAAAAGPLPFEPPHQFRARMRDVTKWMQETGAWAEK